jgi:hypothetical protein
LTLGRLIICGRTPVNALKIAAIAVCVAPLALYVLAAAWAAITGRDLEILDESPLTDPRGRRHLRAVGRLNGPLTALMSGFILVVVAGELLRGKRGPLLAVAAVPVFALFLYLSVRWSFWSWKGVTARELGLDLRTRDNLVQALVIAASVVLGAAAGWFLAFGDLAALLVGAFLGLVVGLLASGTGLMVYRFIRPVPDEDHSDGSDDPPS